MKKEKIGHQVKKKKNPQCRLFCFCKERDRQVLLKDVEMRLRGDG